MTEINKDKIGKLLDQVGPRVKPNQETRDEVYQEVHALWLKTHKKTFFQTHVLKIAASFVIFTSIFTFTLLNKGTHPNYNIAKNLKIQGQIQISHDNINWKNLSIHKTINPGDTIKTLSNNRLFVMLNNGNSFRLDEKSTLKIESNDSFSLVQGQIYIDSNDKNGNHKLTVDTKLASINHIGTRYSISYTDEALKVKVRDGLVLVKTEEAYEHQVEQGKQYTQLIGGEITFDSISPYDNQWSWTQKINQDFEIQGKNMSEYMDWVSDETGYPIKWESYNVKLKAKNVILSGSINGIYPLDSIDVIFPTTRFTYKLHDNQIYISYDND